MKKIEIGYTGILPEYSLRMCCGRIKYQIYTKMNVLLVQNCLLKLAVRTCHYMKMTLENVDELSNVNMTITKIKQT